MHAPFQSDFWLVYLLEAINWRIFEKVLLRSNMKRWLKEKKQAKKEHCQKFSRHLKKAVSVGYFSVLSNEISHVDYLPCRALIRKNKMTCFLKILPNRKLSERKKKVTWCHRFYVMLSQPLFVRVPVRNYKREKTSWVLKKCSSRC